jgi:hypothetical protein
MSELAFTGERFIPGAKGEIWIEHWHRYHFAADKERELDQRRSWRWWLKLPLIRLGILK